MADKTMAPREGIGNFRWPARALVGIAAFSALVNILTLTGSFYMLQVYDRVIPSRSVPTLIGLSLLAALLFVIYGLLDFVRGRIFLRIASLIEEASGQWVFGAIARLPLLPKAGTVGLQPLRDLDQVRAFLSGAGPTAFFDLPWLPFYLAICFLFHPYLGYATLAGAMVLLVVTLLIEVFTRNAMLAAANHGAVRISIAETGRRNADVLAAMGITAGLGEAWQEANGKHLAAHERASDIAAALSSFSKIFRMALQSGVLGLGAYLSIHGEASAGIIIASSILSSRALAPIELVIANWKGFVGARQSWQRLKALTREIPPAQNLLQLRTPRASLTAEALSVVPPNDQRMVVKDISFRLQGGNALGIIGPSASGKSSLARAIVGVWAPARGSVRLDGAALHQWTPEALGQHIGYVPQDIELFSGSVQQNIARFDSSATSEAVIKAAEAAGVHEMIVRLPQGYETRIGDRGVSLSAGQRQRIALARALYGDPFLVVLDEPNSNLDAEGEQALTDAILGVRNRGGIVIVIAHRPSALAAVDLVLMMSNGDAQAFGPASEVLRKVLRSVPPATATATSGAA